MFVCFGVQLFHRGDLVRGCRDDLDFFSPSSLGLLLELFLVVGLRAMRARDAIPRCGARHGEVV